MIAERSPESESVTAQRKYIMSISEAKPFFSRRPNIVSLFVSKSKDLCSGAAVVEGEATAGGRGVSVAASRRLVHQ